MKLTMYNTITCECMECGTKEHLYLHSKPFQRRSEIADKIFKRRKWSNLDGVTRCPACTEAYAMEMYSR